MKDQIGDQRGGSEWEPIKILLKELGLCPKIKPTEPTLAQVNRQGYVVIEELLTLGAILGSPSGSPNQGIKTNRTTPNQTGLPWQGGRVTRQPPEPKRVTRHKGAGHPPTKRTKTGHPDIRGRVTYPLVTLTKGAGYPERPEFQQADDRIKIKTQTNDLLKSWDFNQDFVATLRSFSRKISSKRSRKLYKSKSEEEEQESQRHLGSPYHRGRVTRGSPENRPLFNSKLSIDGSP
jgi:hypothetical protein